MAIVIKSISKIIYPIVRFYWFIFRPKTYGVKCVIYDGEKFLLVTHTYGKGHWTFPGGKIEKGEEPEETVKREMMEELGVEPFNLKFIGKTHNTREYKNDTVWNFSANISNQNLQVNKYELAEVNWYKINDLPEFISPIALEIINLVNEKAGI